MRATVTLLSLLICAAAASATSFVMVSDRDLAAQASLVAEVTVVADAPGATARPATDYEVQVERIVKGDAPGSRLVVRVPGGVGANGIALRVWAAPRFAAGERALLFLRENADGSYSILHLMLGAFHIGRLDGRSIALRDLSQAAELTSTGAPVDRGEEPARDLDRFASWVAEAGGRPADYWLAAPENDGLRNGAQASSDLVGAADGLPIRWFLFDNRGHVDWKMDPAGQPGLGPDASLAAFQAALAVWTADPASEIDYEYAGTTTARSGLTGSDGGSALLFGDPGNASVPGSYSCKTGGVLAMGGPFYYLSERSWGGRSYHEAIEADVVTNDGTDCFFRNNPMGLAEVLGHELGHTLGLGHSADPEAMMYAVAHNDGRGAHLGDDDRLAVNRIYGDGMLQIAPPPAPTPLVLSGQAVSRTRIDLAWTGAAAGADRTIVEQKVGKRFRPLQTLAPGAKSSSLTVRANATYVLRVSVAHGGSMMSSSNLVTVRVPR